MGTENALLDLAARCEALDGRNNGGDMTLLTSDIARALGWVRVKPSEARNKAGHWIAPEDCRDGKPVYDSLHGTEVHRTPPVWLWSLDAAMTLDCPELEKFGGALALLREAMDRLYRAGAGKDALPRYLTAAFLRARASL